MYHSIILSPVRNALLAGHLARLVERRLGERGALKRTAESIQIAVARDERDAQRVIGRGRRWRERDDDVERVCVVAPVRRVVAEAREWNRRAVKRN